MIRKLLPSILIIASMPLLGQVPLNWNLDEINPGEDLTVTPDETRFTEGSRSLKGRLTSGEVPYLVSVQYVVVPGAMYEFSIDVMDSDTNGQVKIYADFYDAAGNNVFGKDPAFSANQPGWQTISWTGTVPPMAAKGYLLVKFHCEPDLYQFIRPAEIWLDQAKFTLQGGTNLVGNGGFESWTLGTQDPSRPRETVIIYPNPARDYLMAETNGRLLRLVITDLTGQSVAEASLRDKALARINISRIPKGIYMIAFYDQNGVVVNKKMVKY